MGIEEPDVVHCARLASGFTYFIVYGVCSHTVDYREFREEGGDRRYRNKAEVEELIRSRLGRDMVVVGASTGSDAHTVGLDAILNLKGFDGEPGLEAYDGIRVYNLGSQVPNEQLVSTAIRVQADAILVAQTVTQQQLHIRNLTQLVDIVEAEGLRERVLLICGGPRLSNELAKELGYDAGFSKGCYPTQVASYIIDELIARAGKTTARTIRSPGEAACG